MLPSILCRALHSALPPWKCISCKLPLPSLHIFLDHVRGSHKVFLVIPFADPQVVDHNHRQHCNSLIFVTGDKPTASWASPGPSGGVVQPWIISTVIIPNLKSGWLLYCYQFIQHIHCYPLYNILFCIIDLMCQWLQALIFYYHSNFQISLLQNNDWNMCEYDQHFRNDSNVVRSVLSAPSLSLPMSIVLNQFFQSTLNQYMSWFELSIDDS